MNRDYYSALRKHHRAIRVEPASSSVRIASKIHPLCSSDLLSRYETHTVFATSPSIYDSTYNYMFSCGVKPNIAEKAGAEGKWIQK